MRAFLTLAATVALAPSLTAQTPDSIPEESSGVMFPVRLAAGGGEHVFTGAGMRTRTFLKVKVYAFGLYVDAAGARANLAGFAGKTSRDLERDDAFYDALLARTFPMTLRLVMTRDVGAETMAEAFDGALRPRVERAAAEMNMPGGVEALEQFRAYFSVEEMTKESVLVFTCTTGGTLSTRIKARTEPDIQSAALCWALFDVYLGDDPISGDGKRKVIARFPEILGATD
ncbi:MAG TPA: chalcone isomerase family protein [Gemmatimonadales bacterium]